MANKPKPSVLPRKTKVIARRRPLVDRAPKATAAKSLPKAQVTSVDVRKIDRLIALLKSRHGATVPDMMEATGWQAHSVRGALSGVLKKGRGLDVTSAKIAGERRYRIGA